MAQAEGAVVTPQALAHALGHATPPAGSNLLHAALYRLRRRVQQAVHQPLPMRAVARAGYVFQGRLSTR